MYRKKDSRGKPAKRLQREKEEQGSVRRFAAGEPEQSGLCDDADMVDVS